MAGRAELDLDADEIVDAAIALLNEEGLDAVSMRNVASRLGVSPVPVYRRVGDKQALLTAMGERLMSGMAPASAEGERWQDYAVRWAHAVHRRLAATADLRLLIGNSRSPFVEATRPLIDSLRAHGFEADEAVQACRLLLWAVAGFTAVEHRRPDGGASSGRRRRPGGDPSRVTKAEAEHLFGLHVSYIVAGIEGDHR